MYRKTLTTLAAAAVLLGASGCTDISTEPRSSVSSSNIFNDPASYRAFLARLYAGLAVSGQEGPAGAGDIGGIDEGFSQYLRLLWSLQQIPTDETVLGWGDAGIPELNRHEWGASNQFLVAMYYRVFFQVALVNEFLRESSDERLASRGATPELRAQVQQFRAEARFLRALSYWHGIDLFGNIPLVRETDQLGLQPPAQATRQAVFEYVVTELNEIRTQLPAARQGQYGRADQAAVDMLLAKLFLNAEAYGIGARYADARAAAERAIAGGHQLAPTYQRNFLADNHTSPEIIFAIPFDGQRTRTWGGMTFLVHAAVGNEMPAADFGIGGGWWGLRTTPQFVALFPGGAASADRRAATIFTRGQSLEVSDLGDFSKGYALPKFRNVTSTGAVGSNTQFPDTDFPVFRLADAYLMYAEAVLRGGGGSRAQALQYVNLLRQRAYGSAAGNIADAEMTLPLLLAERARELYWEGHRRTDLIRFNQFTTSGVWAWKGGTAAGRPTAAHLRLYPLPASELLANPNLRQNEGYN